MSLVPEIANTALARFVEQAIAIRTRGISLCRENVVVRELCRPLLPSLRADLQAKLADGSRALPHPYPARAGRPPVAPCSARRHRPLAHPHAANGYASGTIGRVTALLKYTFRLADKWHFIDTAACPVAEFKVPPDVLRNRFLNNDEATRLVRALRTDPNRTAAQSILLILLTGARRNEITQARWNDLLSTASVCWFRSLSPVDRASSCSTRRRWKFCSDGIGRPTIPISFPRR